MKGFIGLVIVVQIVVYIGMVSLIGWGIWTGARYVSKRGVKSIVEEVWNGTAERE